MHVLLCIIKKWCIFVDLKKAYSIVMECFKRITLILTMVLLLLGCNLLSTECREMRGRYVSFSEEHYEDGISCDVHLTMTEDFNTFSFSNSVEMKATFFLDDAWDFPNMTLTYNISVDGDWSYHDSTLVVSVDTTTFCCDYVGSDARTPTEESMARQIRKNIIAGELMPRIRNEVISTSERTVRVIAKDEEKMVVEHPITKCHVTMIRQH